VEQDCGTVNEFPAGAVFVSEDGGVEGSLTTIGAEVLLHPELCKVESANNIVGLLHQPGSSSGAGTVP